MKHAFLTFGLLAMSVITAVAQKEIEKKLRDELWVNAPAEFRATQVPEKYKNESAVIMALSVDYTLAALKLYVEKANIHLRVKLLDKAAIQEYSELSFDQKHINANMFGKASTYSIVAAKIVKPSGSEKELDLSKAVKTDAGSSTDLKIAIPDLEEGDILDYYVGMKVENYSMPEFNQCDLLCEKYSVVKRTLRYQVPDFLTLISYSYHGAPEFKKSVSGKNNIYLLEDEMRDKAPEVMWTFEHRCSPEIRYYLANSKKIIKKAEAAEDALQGYDIQGADIGFVLDYMKGNFKKENDKKRIVYELFYLLRNPIYMKAYFGHDQGTPLDGEGTPNSFFTVMSKCLSWYKIPYEIMLVPGRHYGPYESLVSFSSCDFMIKVNTSPEIYIPRMNAFNFPGEFNYLFEDMVAVSKTMYPEGGPFPSPENKPMKASGPDDNATKASFHASLNVEDMSMLEVKREIIAKGYNKQAYQYLIFTNYDYLREYDKPKYQVQSSNLFRSLIREYNSEKKKFEQRITQDYNARDKKLEDELEEEFGTKVSGYKNMQVKSIGMWDDAPNVYFTDEYALENMTKKAGPNFIFEIGKLIGNQTEVKEEQKVRTLDIDMNYARSFLNNITFVVPEGYTIEGYENLNKKVENSCGGFISTAQLEGNTLTLTTKKYYSKNHFQAQEWPKMVEFLDAASHLFSSKVLLKKK